MTKATPHTTENMASVAIQRVDLDARHHEAVDGADQRAEDHVDRDHAGAVSGIRAGDVNWMTAGGGVCHTERTPADVRESPHSVAGLQTWVALPVEYEQQEPSFEHADAADIPRHTAPGVQIAVTAGSGWSLHSPVAGSSPLLEAEILLRDASVTIPTERWTSRQRT